MEYVMVPVPEDHVVDVMQYIARLVARASVVAWNKESIEEFFDEVDELGRSLLSAVSRTTVAGKEFGEEDAAKTLELSTREIRAITRELNQEATRRQFEPVLTTKEASVVLRNGRTVQRQLFVMAEPVARMIRAYERASVSDNVTPASAAE
jgi:hypothetical protein